MHFSLTPTHDDLSEKQPEPKPVAGFSHVLKFNPNHDPKDGKFTHGGAAAPAEGRVTIQPVFKPRARNTLQQTHEALAKQGLRFEPLGTRLENGKFNAYYRVSDKNGNAQEFSAEALSKVMTRKEEEGGFAHLLKYDPNQPRNPAGSENGGQWTKAPGGAAAGGGSKVEGDLSHRIGLRQIYKEHDRPGDVQEILGRLSEADRTEVLDRLDRAVKEKPTEVEFAKDGNVGTYTDDRKNLHREIFDKIFTQSAIAAATPARGEAPTLVVLGGRGGSGKSAFTHSVDDKGNVTPARLPEFDSEKFIVLDADKIKEMLPGYEGWNAAKYHEESSYLFKMFRDEAVRRGLNVVLDLTLNSKSPEPVLAAAKAKGYNVEGHYMFAPRALAMERAVKRYLGEGPHKRGRLVLLDVINKNTDNESNFEDLSRYFTKWSAYDGRENGKPRLISRGTR